jgi:hypothetical protein
MGRCREDQVLFVGLGSAENRGQHVIRGIGLPYIEGYAPAFPVEIAMRLSPPGEGS